MPDQETTIEPVLDHVVVNTLGRLDEAAQQYRRLGFTLTARGHHSLGSSNNLAIFGTDYLELLGFLPGKEGKRAELWAHPPGLTGLAFKSGDPDLVYNALRARGVPVAEPVQFARPVELAEGARDARFSVVRVTGDAVANGRAFFCHHLTPELVWRPEWQTHANAAAGVAELLIAAREPARTAAVYERMFGPGLLRQVSGGVSFRAGTARVSVLDPAAVARRTAQAAPASADGSDRMVALALQTGSLAAARSALADGGIAFEPLPEGGIVVPHQQAGEVALIFVE